MLRRHGESEKKETFSSITPGSIGIKSMLQGVVKEAWDLTAQSGQSGDGNPMSTVAEVRKEQIQSQNNRATPWVRALTACQARSNETGTCTERDGHWDLKES